MPKAEQQADRCPRRRLCALLRGLANAHYDSVKNYRNQADAQTHYLELTGLSKKNAKMLPDDFPWDGAAQAAARCHLPTDSLPEPDTQGPCPSTTMPHLFRSLGLLSVDEF